MRQRTSYPKPFKAQVVQECLQPGVSMASVALRHGINANLVRKWIPAYRDCQEPALPASCLFNLAGACLPSCRPACNSQTPADD
ncbi:MAG: transposase [Pseudomonas sp.]|uniref:transposase n=1 Tax=Pseudomonas sp. TaxID=306 RepID=UPI003D6F467B